MGSRVGRFLVLEGPKQYASPLETAKWAGPDLIDLFVGKIMDDGLTLEGGGPFGGCVVAFKDRDLSLALAVEEEKRMDSVFIWRWKGLLLGGQGWKDSRWD